MSDDIRKVNVMLKVKSKIHNFFFDSFNFGDSYLFCINDLSTATEKRVVSYTYLRFVGRLLYSPYDLMLTPSYYFYLPESSFSDCLGKFVNFGSVDLSKSATLFVWLERVNKKKLLFHHNKILQVGSFDYEREKGLFISDCVKKGLVLDRKYYSS